MNTVPAIARAGTMSLFGDGKRARTFASFLRRRRKEAFTMTKRSRNIIPAEAAITLRGRKDIATMAAPLARIATYGVLLRRWIAPKARGRVPSRPIAKATREAEKIVALSAETAPAMRAPTRMSPPAKGRK